MVSFLTTVFLVVVFIPIMAICFFTISQRVRFKPVLYGILVYTVIAIAAQVLTGLANAASGGYIGQNAVLYVILKSVLTAAFMILLEGIIYKKRIENISFGDGLGFGLGLGGLWLIATVGITLLFSLAAGMTLAEVEIQKNIAASAAEAIDEYNSLKEKFLSKSIMDYILLAVSGISMMAVTVANSVLMVEYIRKSEKKYMIIALCAQIAVLIPFIISYEAGFVNPYVQIFMCVLAVAAMWYMIAESKKYPLEEKEAFVRHSPLEGRDFTKRIKKRK